MADLKTSTARELLALHADITDELRRRGILRTGNNPVGDLAEHLFCRAFGWTQTTKSHPAADAVCPEGRLYQIKGRRLATPKTSRELGALRDLSAGGFHFLAGVLFGPDYSIVRAAIVPHALILENAKFYSHTNASKFHLRDQVWGWPEVRDVTRELQAVAL